MSGAPIWAADRPDGAALAAAGWSEADLTWEIIQVTAAETWAAGEEAEADELWHAGLEVAREHFAGSDPRLATSLANQAAALRRAGDGEAAEALFAEAVAVWDTAGPWIAALKPEVRARSSLFHLRLQARHKGGYNRFSREKYEKLAAEGRGAIVALRDGVVGAQSGRAQHGLERWRRERPPGYGDQRLLLAAALLVAEEASSFERS